MIVRYFLELLINANRVTRRNGDVLGLLLLNIHIAAFGFAQFFKFRAADAVFTAGNLDILFICF